MHHQKRSICTPIRRSVEKFFLSGVVALQVALPSGHPMLRAAACRVAFLFVGHHQGERLWGCLAQLALRVYLNRSFRRPPTHRSLHVVQGWKLLAHAYCVSTHGALLTRHVLWRD